VLIYLVAISIAKVFDSFRTLMFPRHGIFKAIFNFFLENLNRINISSAITRQMKSISGNYI